MDIRFNCPHCDQHLSIEEEARECVWIALTAKDRLKFRAALLRKDQKFLFPGH